MEENKEIVKMSDEGPYLSEILFDDKTGKSYRRERFIGKGGFGKCYQIVDIQTNNIYAGKIVSKKLMVATNLKGKMVEEIVIHRTLDHSNVVKFYDFFDDIHYVYIILELCKNRSMLELYKRRKNITEYECRYYMHQIIQGVKYLHDNRIIHRDLKLANLFLDDFLHVKIGDFGLAARIEHEGERKMTLCGTPNYIAPEILTKKGHSFEVDIWSLGCIMYALLVGHPPFETKSVKGTYAKIRKCEYHLPIYILRSAASIIIATLNSKPEKRPKINDLLKFDFFSNYVIPAFLPNCCLTMAPRIESRKLLKNIVIPQKKLTKNVVSTTCTSLELSFLKDSIKVSAEFVADKDYCFDFQRLCLQLKDLTERKLKILTQDLDIENSDPAAQPIYWISKWMDYSDKYGFGYQLCDGSIGVLFNDMTKIIQLPNQIDVHYIDFEGKESYMTTTDYCKSLEKKMKLLGLYKRYMTENLVNTTAKNVVLERDLLSRMPHLHAWFRTKSVVCMFLTNGTVQMNFIDHMKLVFCSRMKALTYIDSEKNFRTYRFSTLIENGCSKTLYQKLRYACEQITKMVEQME